MNVIRGKYIPIVKMAKISLQQDFAFRIHARAAIQFTKKISTRRAEIRRETGLTQTGKTTNAARTIPTSVAFHLFGINYNVITKYLSARCIWKF